MGQKFLESLEKNTPNYEEIFEKLYKGVLETNKLIGLDPKDMTDFDRLDLINTYKLLREEEIKEVVEALEKEDKVNLLGELIDVLVVSGFEYFLINGFHYREKPKMKLCSDIGSSLDILSKTKSLNITLHYTQSVLQLLGCDVEKAVDEILKANLSKFPTPADLMCSLGDLEIGDNVVDKQIEILEEGGRYGGVSAEKVVDIEGEERYVFWSSTDRGEVKVKYLKAVSFVEAFLDDCWK